MIQVASAFQSAVCGGLSGQVTPSLPVPSVAPDAGHHAWLLFLLARLEQEVGHIQSLEVIALIWSYFSMLKYFSMACMVYVKVCYLNENIIILSSLLPAPPPKVFGQKAAEPISPQQMRNVGLLLLLLLGILFHLLLSFLGY